MSYVALSILFIGNSTDVRHGTITYHMTRGRADGSGFSFSETLLHFSPLQRIVAIVFLSVMLISGISYTRDVAQRHLVDIPRKGGTYREAIIGTPRFINPVLAVSGADRDLVALLYAGMMSRDSSGSLVPQLAESFTVSDDGRTYTFTLRKDATFHDGTPVTSGDVVFTIEQVQNPSLRSPQFSSWENVVIEAPDEHTVVISLPEPYAPFIENATLGILPRHIWEPLADDQFSFSALNTNPIGAGPYYIKEVIVDASGIPTRYELEAFKSYVYGTPNISKVHLLLFPSRVEAFAAYIANEVHAVHGIPAPDVAALLQDPSGEHSVLRTPQLRVFGIFLNQNKQPIFLDKDVRHALSESISKDILIQNVFHGYASALDTPILFDTPDSMPQSTTTTGLQEDATISTNTTRAREILEDAGWVRTDEGSIYSHTDGEETRRLSFTLSTVNSPDLVAVAELVSGMWRDMGAEVELKVYEAADLTQSVIRPRRHEALLFGMELGHELDLYAFWHSSQRNDPGLNISQYADIESDTILETLRTTLDPEERDKLLRSFTDRITNDHTGIFLFAPDLLYLSHNDVHNVRLHPLANPSERFHTIHEWYMQTDRVWPIIKTHI